jgi:hypothetical protein
VAYLGCHPFLGKELVMLEFFITSLIIFGHVLMCLFFAGLLVLLGLLLWNIASKPIEEYEE